MLWGNQEIKYYSKCLFFQEWIKHDILFVNDIIHEKEEIAENFINNKLMNKSNWISQINKTKVALPNLQKFILKSENSLKTTIKTQLKTEIYVSKGKTIYLDNINNKIIYNNIVNCKVSKPYVHTYCDTYFNNGIN